MRVVRQKAAMGADQMHAIVRELTAGHRAATNADLRIVVPLESARTRKRANRNRRRINLHRAKRLSLRHPLPTVPNANHRPPPPRRRLCRRLHRPPLSLQGRQTTQRLRTPRQKTIARARAAAAAVVAVAVAATRTRSTRRQQCPTKRSCLTSTMRMPIAAMLANRVRNSLPLQLNRRFRWHQRRRCRRSRFTLRWERP